jgi:hypothetical protein
VYDGRVDDGLPVSCEPFHAIFGEECGAGGELAAMFISGAFGSQKARRFGVMGELTADCAVEPRTSATARVGRPGTMGELDVGSIADVLLLPPRSNREVWRREPVGRHVCADPLLLAGRDFPRKPDTVDELTVRCISYTQFHPLSPGFEREGPDNVRYADVTCVPESSQAAAFARNIFITTGVCDSVRCLRHSPWAHPGR